MVTIATHRLRQCKPFSMATSPVTKKPIAIRCAACAAKKSALRCISLPS
ncbi:Uncharacterised protein [Vibrio cholerae]|nr:Uncharacterised protein [Vibrio cholerae]